MNDAHLLRGLVVLVAFYGVLRAVRGEWSGVALSLGVGALALLT